MPPHPAVLGLTVPQSVPLRPPSAALPACRATNAAGGALGGKSSGSGSISAIRRANGAGACWIQRAGQGSAERSSGGEGWRKRGTVCRAAGQGFGGSAGGEKGEGGKGKAESGAFGGLDWKEVARPAPPMLDLSKPRVYYFALANAYSLMDKGALLEEVLADGIRRSQRGGRSKDVWMVMEPAFLEHPSLAKLKAAIPAPTAAIVSTNGDWMLTIVHEMLPQATIGKFYAPTPQLPDPLKSKLTPGDIALGGGGIWH